MRYEMDAAIKEAIGKHIPAEAGDLLRDRLNLADKLEEENATLNDQLNGWLDRCVEAEANVAKQATFDAREAAQLDVARNHDETRRKLDVEKQLNDLRVESAHLRLADMRETLKLIFGNRVIRERVQGQVPVHVVSEEYKQTGSGTFENVVVDHGEILLDTETTTETEEA